MPFNKYGPADTEWVDVDDLKNIPFGARKIRADNFLNRVEDYLAEGLHSELDATYATKMELVQDLARPGIYTLSSNWTTEDPARPGIYTIGA